MKKYKEFLNEANSPDNFIFAIYIKKATTEEIDKIFELAVEYFDDFLEYNTWQRKDIDRYKPWAIVFNMYKDFPSSKKIKAALSIVTNPGFGTGYKHMEDIVTLKEFLNVGFENIEKYIEIKNDTNKYNL